MDQAEQDCRRLKDAANLLRQNKLKESESLYKQLITSRHVGPSARGGLGVLYLQQGKTSEAERLFKSVISEGHQVAEAYYGLGVINEPSDPSYARAQYEFALRINPNHRGSLARIKRLQSTVSPTPSVSPAPSGGTFLRNYRLAILLAATVISVGMLATFSQRGSPTGPLWLSLFVAVIILLTATIVHRSKSTERKSQGGRAAPFEQEKTHKASPKSRIEFRGIAASVRSRTEQRGNPPRQFQVIEFRLQRGEGLSPIQVYMGGFHLKGMIKDGDQIELKDKRPREGTIYETGKIYNESVGAHVETYRTLSDTDLGKFVSWVAFIFVVLIVGLIAVTK